VRVSLRAVPGVDSVAVSLEKGLAAVKMKQGNTTTLKQLNEAIAKNGFTMKDSRAVVAGTVAVTNGGATLTVSGSNDLLQLVPESVSGSSASTMVGKTVVVEGTIPEAGKGKAPDSIRYKSMTEEKSQ
jgi:3-hydroxyisobutyrate dehydrogenase-like beta-hydroxyacid dehydrogenase